MFEDHKVVTDDGYILTLFRIRQKDLLKKTPAVLMQHGIMDTADAFIIHDSEKAPAMVLARRGFDVWLGNNRGTRYSLGHKFLKYDKWEDQAEYNDFSWHE